MPSLTLVEAVEHVWREQQAREARQLAELPSGALSSSVTRESETVLLTLTRLAKLCGLVVSLPAVDTRPIVDCPTCSEQTVALPNGRCAWCETQLGEPAA